MFGFKIARIDGRSMEPMLVDGSFALFRRRYRREQGEVILVNHKEFGLIVKQVADIAPNGEMVLAGLSPESTSTERLGRVSREQVQGTLVAPIPLLRWRRTRH
ncbi:MAG: S24/S26 family peptidase [Pseudomonadota bacterium]